MAEFSLAGWTRYDDEGFIGLIGPFWRRCGGRTRYGFVAEARHANLLGVVQGGMLMTFADRALGLEAWAAADGEPSATIQFGAEFLAPAPVGAFLEIEPALLRRTGSLIFMSGAVAHAGEPVMQVHGVWKILRGRPFSAVERR